MLLDIWIFPWLLWIIVFGGAAGNEFRAVVFPLPTIPIHQGLEGGSRQKIKKLNKCI
jgi:hypothetical protein